MAHFFLHRSDTSRMLPHVTCLERTCDFLNQVLSIIFPDICLLNLRYFFAAQQRLSLSMTPGVILLNSHSTDIDTSYVSQCDFSLSCTKQKKYVGDKHSENFLIRQRTPTGAYVGC